MTLLLVEDSPSDAALLEEYVPWGTRVHHVTTLRRAREALDGGASYDVALLDLGLPDASGMDAVLEMLRIPGCPPVVVLTGLDDNQLGRQAVRLGAQDFLSKGAIEPESLERALLHAMERHEQATQLHRTQEQLEAIFKATPAALLTTTAEGRILSCNQQAHTLFQPNGDLAGRSIANLLPEVRLADVEQPTALQEQLAHRVNGEPLPVEVSVAPFDAPGGGAFVVMALDISARKASEEALELAQQKLQEAAHDAGRAEVARNLIHDIGNVLSSISVSAELLQGHLSEGQERRDNNRAMLGGDSVEECSEETLRHWAQAVWRTEDAELALNNEIFGELQELRQRVQHVKAMMVAEQQGRKIRRSKTDVAELAREAIRICQPFSSDAGARVVLSGASVAPLHSERDKVLQVLTNLIKNAVEATQGSPDPTVQVDVMCTTDAVRIEVTDNGVGIEPDCLSRVFAHGYSTKSDGSGLGLRSSALRARELGACLEAFSDGRGKGARFTFSLPTRRNEARRS